MPPRWLQVVAEALTITGSIGVVTGKFNLQDLYRRVGYGKEVLSRCVGVGGWVWRWVGVAGGGGKPSGSVEIGCVGGDCCARRLCLVARSGAWVLQDIVHPHPAPSHTRLALCHLPSASSLWSGLGGSQLLHTAVHLPNRGHQLSS